MTVATGDVLWRPPADVLESSRIGHFSTWLREHRGLDLRDHDALWRWSVQDLDGFWSAIWEFFDVADHGERTAVLSERVMPGARWFPGLAAELRRARAARGRCGRRRRRGHGPLADPSGPRSRPGANCGRRWPAPGRCSSISACAPGTGWPATCPTVPRRSSRSWPPPGSARCGPAARSSSGRAASSTGSGRSSRWSCSSPAATATGARTSTGGPRSPRSWPGLPTVTAVLDIEYGPWRVDGARSWPGCWPTSDARRVGRDHPGALRPSARRPVLLRHHRQAEGDRPRPRRHRRRTSEEPRAVVGPRPRRRAALVLDDGLDDVERAGVGVVGGRRRS